MEPSSPSERALTRGNRCLLTSTTRAGQVICSLERTTHLRPPTRAVPSKRTTVRKRTPREHPSTDAEGGTIRLLEFVTSDPPRRIRLHPRFTVIGGFGGAHAIADDVDTPDPESRRWEGAVDIGGRTVHLAELWRGGHQLSSLILRSRDLPRPEPSPPVPPVDAVPPVAAIPEADGNLPLVADQSDPKSQSDPKIRSRLRARRTALARALAEAVPDPGPISDALADLTFAVTAARHHTAERRALARSWSEIVAELSELEAISAPSPDFVRSAERDLDAALAERSLAERALGIAAPELLETLDRAHAELEAAETQSRGRFARAATRQRVDQLVAAERAILDELGFISYGDRYLSEALQRPDPTIFDRLERANALVADAEGVMAELTAVAGVAERRATLELESERCRAQASLLLNGTVATDAITALRTAPDVGVLAAEDVLRRLLRSPSLPSEALQAAAEEVLADIGDAVVRREKAEAEWKAVVTELALLDAPPDQAVPPTTAPARDAAVATDTGVATDPGGTEVNELEMYLLARLFGQRDIPGLGAVPLVIDDALCDLRIEVRRAGLNLLERMSDAVQIVYVTDDPDIAAWARFIGANRAAVVDAPDSLPSITPRPEPLGVVAEVTVPVAPSQAVDQRSDDAPAVKERRAHCSWCPNQLASGSCAQCGRLLCEDHLFRTSGRKAKTFCIPCGLVAAGVSQRVRRR